MLNSTDSSSASKLHHPLNTKWGQEVNEKDIPASIFGSFWLPDVAHVEFLPRFSKAMKLCIPPLTSYFLSPHSNHSNILNT
jgi:hypothetical protein